MAFLHCHTPGCQWEQDDFWDKIYNPCRSMLDWEDELLSKTRDKIFSLDTVFVREYGNITIRDVIAQEFERKAKIIRNMLVPTWAEWKDLEEKPCCPRCGQRNWDID